MDCGEISGNVSGVLLPTLMGVGLWSARVVLQFLIYGPSSLFYVEIND